MVQSITKQRTLFLLCAFCALLAPNTAHAMFREVREEARANQADGDEDAPGERLNFILRAFDYLPSRATVVGALEIGAAIASTRVNTKLPNEMQAPYQKALRLARLTTLVTYPLMRAAFWLERKLLQQHNQRESKIYTALHFINSHAGWLPLIPVLYTNCTKAIDSNLLATNAGFARHYLVEKPLLLDGVSRLGQT